MSDNQLQSLTKASRSLSHEARDLIQGTTPWIHFHEITLVLSPCYGLFPINTLC